mmetsp:Transcript_30384/g.85270  ORF Transcript_30384/g.85270 Transcript_30384/m.85270 type:complete len:84 (+) Transcript_30384:106-357(+)
MGYGWVPDVAEHDWEFAHGLPVTATDAAGSRAAAAPAPGAAFGAEAPVVQATLRRAQIFVTGSDLDASLRFRSVLHSTRTVPI